jgi:hypothetical protein
MAAHLLSAVEKSIVVHLEKLKEVFTVLQNSSGRVEPPPLLIDTACLT